MNDTTTTQPNPPPPPPGGGTYHPVTLGAWLSVFEFIKTVGFILVAAFLIRHFLIQPFVVDGASMEPNFHNQEYILVDKVTYRLREPQRGDVVVFHPPGRTDSFIKRVIGLPGERIDIQGHQVSINGVALNEKYLPTFSSLSSEEESSFSRILQKDEYFVMGDNRDQSKDSRELGPIGKERIIGRSWLILYPIQNVSVVQQPRYTTVVKTSQTQALARFHFLADSAVHI